MNLFDLPQPVPEVFVKAIQARLGDALRGEAMNRLRAVREGQQTPEVAACLLDQFAHGLMTLSDVIGAEAGSAELLTQLLHQIDPDFEAHRVRRWAARPLAFAVQGEPPPG